MSERISDVCGIEFYIGSEKHHCVFQAGHTGGHGVFLNTIQAPGVSFYDPMPDITKARATIAAQAARIEKLEQALEAQAVCDGEDGILCFCTLEFREGGDDDSEHAAYCQIARAALAKPKEAKNG